jgi:cell division protein FtsL
MRNNNKNRISLFNFLIGLFSAVGVIVFLVYNIIYVNSLVVENNLLKEEIRRVSGTNNSLQAEIEYLTTYDKIKPAAEGNLKLTFLKQNIKILPIEKSQLVKTE